METFERVGAEALLLLLPPPEEVLVGREQEIQPAKGPGKEEWCHMSTLVSDCAARSMECQTMRRQSGAEGYRDSNPKP